MTDAGHQVTIQMSLPTVESLSRNGSSLYAFKAVRSSSQAGRPLVWSASRSYSTTTTMSWRGPYEAYTSSDPIAPSGRIRAGFSSEITLGQTLRVSDQGVGDVVSGGSSAAITFSNTTTTPFTIGISESQGGADAAPYCAFPLFGLNLEAIVPTGKILLMFSTDSISPGTVIEDSLGGAAAISAGGLATAFFVAVTPGVLIDLASAPSAQVTFDINSGWASPSVPAVSVGAGEDLVPLLIEA